jgi:hypothetical protein
VIEQGTMSSKKTGSRDLRVALISDTGGPAASATTFYYNVGSKGNGFAPTNSFGPGPAAVSKVVQGWKPEHLLAIGDLAYNAGGSTLQDISIGQYYNNFIYPYPSPNYLTQPYTTINGEPTRKGQKAWPYNVYDFPKGFPNPVTGKRGGSPDRANRFWGSLGNHDYGMAIGYGQVGLTPYKFDGTPTSSPAGPSSATSVESSIDYFMPFLEKPSWLGRDQKRLNVGAVDVSGNRGAYYSISFGGSVKKPLVDFFMLDTERLNINAGFESWNPTGQRELNPVTGLYEDAVNDDKSYSLTYDPTNPNSVALADTTTDPDNGHDQYQWLRQSLEESRATWKVITGHHPVYASGRWSDDQPDDHMSNPYLQRLLNALPEGSFDAYYNGHDHYYERVLESKDGGIGLGIPFITNGNSGRNLSKKIQVPYGVSVYEPTAFGAPDTTNPNLPALPYLLDSGPLEVASSGLAGGGSKEETNFFANGLYGYGFGATKLNANKNYMLFQYEEAPVIDPAIANHLKGGQDPERGFKGTKPSDWIPNPDGDFKGQSDLAQFKLAINNGVVTGVELLNGGRGYMSSKGGSHTVEGFNIYGNNVDPLQPWKGTAQVDLTFANGMLSGVTLTDGGKGYELAVQAAADDNTATSTEGLSPNSSIVIPLNYNIEETQYLVRDNTLYNDFYLITESRPIVELIGKPGEQGLLRVSVQAASRQARRLLAKELEPTTGYSGSGSQTFSRRAQDGDITVYHRGNVLAKGNLENGIWEGTISRLPRATGDLVVDFSGDPITSYNVNFKPSSGKAKVVRGQFKSQGPTSLIAEPETSLLFAPSTGEPAQTFWGGSSSEPWLLHEVSIANLN